MSKNVIKRLVEEIKNVDLTSEENLPIEYYELKELAKTRVLLKGSIKIHAIVYMFVNLFVLILNLFGRFTEINTIFDMWFIWVILGWGLILWSHSVIVISVSVVHLEQRIFAITVSILAYIAGFLVFINYFVNHATNSEYYWWPWAAVFIALFSAAYAYIVFEKEDTSKMERRIGIEIEKMKDEEEIRKEKQALKISKKEEKSKSILKEMGD